MALILERISDGYKYALEEMADSRVRSYFLMDSPFPLICLTGVYLLFVLKIGPKWMESRPAYNLDRLLIVYNSLQIIACFYMVWVHGQHIFRHYSLFCQPIDYSDDENARVATRYIWMYFIIKIIDLLDTVFFVLRKKNNQITFLHLYHHTGMCYLTWITTKYIAGGHSLFVAFINNIVHVIMYGYYLFTAWDKQYKNNIWWKKHLTQIQILQFVIITIYFLQLLFQPSCGYPKWIVWYFVPQNIFMIVLFTNFYIESYVKPPVKSRKVAASTPTANGVEDDKAKSQ